MGGQEETGTSKGSASAARQRHILGLHHSALPLEMLWKPFSSGLFHFSHGKCALTPDLGQHCLLQSPRRPPPCKCSEQHYLQLFIGIRDPFHELRYLAVLEKLQSETQAKILWKKSCHCALGPSKLYPQDMLVQHIPARFSFVVSGS